MDELQENLLYKLLDDGFEGARRNERSRSYNEACMSYLKISSLMRKVAYQLSPERAKDFFEEVAQVERRFSAMRAKTLNEQHGDISKSAFLVHRPRFTFGSFANKELGRKVEESLKRSRLFLVYGPEGGGKKFVAQVAAKEAGGSLYYIRANTILSKYFGEPESIIAELFSAAIDAKPSVIYIDEFDAFATKNLMVSDNAKNALNLLKARLEYINAYKELGVYVFCGCTEPWALNQEIHDLITERLYIPLPNTTARILLFKKSLSGSDYTNVGVEWLAGLTENFTARDIHDVCSEVIKDMVMEQNALDSIGPREFEARMLQRELVPDDFTKAIGKLEIKPKALPADYEEWKREHGG